MSEGMGNGNVMGNGNEVGVIRMRDNREYNKGAGRRERGRREKGGGEFDISCCSLLYTFKIQS